MIEPMLIEARKVVPLTIESIEWNDPTLFFNGHNWSFRCACAWRLIQHAIVICGCWDKNVNQHLLQLIGEKIVAIAIQSTSIDVDPVFILSNQKRLEIFATDTIEPWIFRLPMGQVFVASPSDPDAFMPREDG